MLWYPVRAAIRAAISTAVRRHLKWGRWILPASPSPQMMPPYPPNRHHHIKRHPHIEIRPHMKRRPHIKRRQNMKRRQHIKREPPIERLPPLVSYGILPGISNIDTSVARTPTSITSPTAPRRRRSRKKTGYTS